MRRVLAGRRSVLSRTHTTDEAAIEKLGLTARSQPTAARARVNLVKNEDTQDNRTDLSLDVQIRSEKKRRMLRSVSGEET
jgi:hypothetical protein